VLDLSPKVHVWVKPDLTAFVVVSDMRDESLPRLPVNARALYQHGIVSDPLDAPAGASVECALPGFPPDEHYFFPFFLPPDCAGLDGWSMSGREVGSMRGIGHLSAVVAVQPQDVTRK